MPPTGKKELLTDAHNRSVSYLRVSVTDRCNLRCRYCMTEQTQWLPKGAILTLEEIHRVVQVATTLGITKVRLTGGEPLCRKGIVGLIERLHQIEGLKDIALTTNGTLLADLAPALKQAGLRRINISLDTLEDETFRQITGRDLWTAAWKGIEAALAEGLHPVKLNCVAMRQYNDHQIERMAELTRHFPLHVRFIEYMPIGIDPRQGEKHFISIEEIKNRLERMGQLTPIAAADSDGPAQRFRLDESPGEIGLIGSMSTHFCSRCNRLRLTADGHLRACLLADDQIDLITPLRQGASDDQIRDLFNQTLALKGKMHRMRFDGNCTVNSKMAGIGG